MHLKISELKNSELKRFFLKKKQKAKQIFFNFLADSHSLSNPTKMADIP